jgi:hypothetical protein
MPEHQKYRVGVKHYHAVPERLEQVYILTAHDEPDIRIEPIGGIKRMDALIKNSYRYAFLKGQELKGQHFRQCAAAAQQVAIFRVFRPRDAFLLDELADAVERSTVGNDAAEIREKQPEGNRE